MWVTSALTSLPATRICRTSRAWHPAAQLDRSQPACSPASLLFSWVSCSSQSWQLLSPRRFILLRWLAAPASSVTSSLLCPVSLPGPAQLHCLGHQFSTGPSPLHHASPCPPASLQPQPDLENGVPVRSSTVQRRGQCARTVPNDFSSPGTQWLLAGSSALLALQAGGWARVRREHALLRAVAFQLVFSAPGHSALRLTFAQLVPEWSLRSVVCLFDASILKVLILSKRKRIPENNLPTRTSPICDDVWSVSLVQVGAHFLEAVVRKFDDVYRNGSEGKECDNLFTIVAHLYNFHVVHSLLVFDILKKLIRTFTEKDIELILLMLKNVGFSLRKDDALSLKELISETQAKASGAGSQFQDQTRVRARHATCFLSV